ADLAREADGDPPAARAEVGDDAVFADLQRIHDLIRPLPRVAVGAFELAEVFRRKRPGVLGGRLRARDAGDCERHKDLPRHWCAFFPGMPGEVMTSGDRMSASCASGSSLRSRTSSASERRVRPPSLAMSAVRA